MNALAIFVFSSQLPQVLQVPWLVYPLVALGIVVVIVMPKITKLVPAPLVWVVMVTGVVLTFTISPPTVGDQDELPRSLPELFSPNVPLRWETFTIIAPFALGVAAHREARRRDHRHPLAQGTRVGGRRECRACCRASSAVRAAAP